MLAAGVNLGVHKRALVVLIRKNYKLYNFQLGRHAFGESQGVSRRKCIRGPGPTPFVQVLGYCGNTA